MEDYRCATSLPVGGSDDIDILAFGMLRGGTVKDKGQPIIPKRREQLCFCEGDVDGLDAIEPKISVASCIDEGVPISTLKY